MNRKLALLLALILLIFSKLFAQSSPIKATITGKGKQTIIFIPGFACSGDVWNETTPLFDARYTCIVLTMPGIAGVPALPKANMTYWEELIVNYIREHHIENPIIVGHSLGGGLAMALTADHPALVSKVVIVDALPCFSAMQFPTFKSNNDNDCSSMIATMTAQSDAQFYQMQRSMIPKMVSDTSHMEQIAHWGVTSDRKTLGAMYCDFLNTDNREKIAHIQCPTLVLLEASFEYMKPMIEEQYKQLKGVQFAYATKGLHFIMYDDTNWYNQQLTAFIK